MFRIGEGFKIVIDQHSHAVFECLARCVYSDAAEKYARCRTKEVAKRAENNTAEHSTGCARNLNNLVGFRFGFAYILNFECCPDNGEEHET
ncbi:hypothetical protein BC361_32175 [Ensifer sp. LC54]|nr:hypothetical protein BC361_32175 [Ensifer sp. LC54]OCP20986.1 hypothetical protein BC363_29280 [Ensifer sp. LC384]